MVCRLVGCWATGVRGACGRVTRSCVYCGGGVVYLHVVVPYVVFRAVLPTASATRASSRAAPLPVCGVQAVDAFPQEPEGVRGAVGHFV